MLIGSKLRKADFTAAHLQAAQLGQSDLRGSKFDCGFVREGYPPEQCPQLQGASLDRASLQGARLSWVETQGTSLWGANLQDASLDHARLQGASLGLAQLQGVSLEGAALQST